MNDKKHSNFGFRCEVLSIRIQVTGETRVEQPSTEESLSKWKILICFFLLIIYYHYLLMSFLVV